MLFLSVEKPKQVSISKPYAWVFFAIPVRLVTSGRYCSNLADYTQKVDYNE